MMHNCDYSNCYNDSLFIQFHCDYITKKKKISYMIIHVVSCTEMSHTLMHHLLTVKS